ncbi:hypothetical protein FQN49_006262 [Arthroderma sp. PD_2]|nr:hypothetical protein FQN49_006262 [Arthroderma sp. PD_2]
MALWPFGRHKKRARKGEDETYAAPVDQPQQLASARPHTPPAQTAATAAATDGRHGTSAGKLVRRDSKRQKYSPALQQTQHNASSIFHRSSPAAATTSTAAAGPSSAFSTPQADSPMTLPNGRTLRQPTSVDTFASVNALSPSKLRSAPKMVSQPADNEAYPVPTLHGKRNSTEPSILRRRSDRRRRNDAEREQEIKRMGSVVWDPKRNQKDASKASDRHLSDPFTSYSSPLSPDPAEAHTFKLGAFNALSPRPFLRYGEGNRSSLPPTAEISRSSTTKDKGKSRWFSADHSTANNNNNKNKRIEDLADSMDAGALRQLMDRDRRRRLVKRQILREQQQQASTTRPRPAKIEVKVPVENEQPMGSPTDLPSSPDRMDISKTPDQSESWLRDASKESLLVKDQDEAITEVKENIPPAASSPTVVSRNGQTLELAIPPGEQKDEIPDIRQHPAFRQPSVSEASTKPSTQNETKLGRTWTQIFRRRGTLRNKPSVPPKNNSSEFSVTSRDSRSRVSQQYHPAPVATPTQRAGTDTQSIQSKFTEHLDDGSVPQGTRMYSAESSSNINRDDAYSVSHRMSGGEMYSISGISTGAYVPGPDTRPNSTFLAQSLASIDSEGSWLSGRPSRRLSQAPLKSPGSTRERVDDMIEPNDEDDDNGVSSDEYFGSLPVPKEEEEDAHVGNKEVNSNAITNGHHEPIASADDADTSPIVEDGMQLANAEGDPPTWHSSVGKRARLISPETRAKSREGLFTEFIDSENEVSPIDETEPEIRRAQSVDLGRHIRQISAGSAKIVTLCRAESKRYSTASVSSAGVLPSKTDEEVDVEFQ